METDSTTLSNTTIDFVYRDVANDSWARLKFEAEFIGVAVPWKLFDSAHKRAWLATATARAAQIAGSLCLRDSPAAGDATWCSRGNLNGSTVGLAADDGRGLDTFPHETSTPNVFEYVASPRRVGGGPYFLNGRDITTGLCDHPIDDIAYVSEHCTPGDLDASGENSFIRT